MPYLRDWAEKKPHGSDTAAVIFYKGVCGDNLSVRLSYVNITTGLGDGP